MEYKCQTIGMDRMAIGTNGFFSPICETCGTQDCTNPIEKTKVSVLGVVKEIKIYNRGREPRLVVQCEGYMP